MVHRHAALPIPFNGIPAPSQLIGDLPLPMPCGMITQSKLKEMPINDFFAKGGRIREDGRMGHDMYLFEVKEPQESKGRWDDYKLLATVSGNDAFQSLE